MASLDTASLASPTPAGATGAVVSDATRAKIHKAAQDFEGSFLQVMMGSMFSSVGSSQDAAFGGGQAEGQFRSFLTDAMAKGVVKHGGVGVSQTIERELLKLQGAHA